MWNYLLLVAVVQGATEFLPISSSAHLILLPAVTGAADQGLTIDVAAHLGSLVAVLVYFWRDVRALVTDGLTLRWSQGLVAPLLVATIPIVLAGFALKAFVAGDFRSAWLIATTTIFFGIVLYVTDRAASDRSVDDISLGHALVVGLAQVLALIPGTSRSGITISAARALGYERAGAARFSMLLGIPAILGASLLMGVELQAESDWRLGADAAFVAAVSFVVAWLAIAGLMRWLQHASLLPFVIYRIALGVALLAWLSFQ